MNIHRKLWHWCRRPTKPASTNFTRLVTPLYVSILVGVLLLAAYTAFAVLPSASLFKSSHDETEGWMPKELERVSFPGGAIVVRKIQYNPSVEGYISIGTEPHITSEEDLLAYVNSRTDALNELLNSMSPNETMYATVAFKEPLERMDFVSLWRDYLEEPLEYAVFVENETSGEFGTLVLGMPSHDEPDFMRYFTNPKGFKLISVVAFAALLRVDAVEALKQDSGTLLVDPQKCLTIRGLVKKYSALGLNVSVQLPPFLHSYMFDLLDFTP